MKIIVQGNIIDTENICYITEIYYDSDIYCNSFQIIFLNNIKIVVYNNVSQEKWIIGKTIVSKEEKEKAKETAKNQLIDLRNRIVTAWSNNQTKLEKFDIIK